MTISCYFFDIDGTLSDLSHRLHHIHPQDGVPKNWDAFFSACGDDSPIEHICELARILSDADQVVVLISGRSDQVRAETEDWLERHEISYSKLYMRKAGDHRPDHLIKAELLNEAIADGYRPVMAFEDRSQVVEMWRERGIPCAQVADGNF